MLISDIFQLSEFVLEPEKWVKIAITFISNNSKLEDKDLLNCIKKIILQSNVTFQEIFECCLKVYQLNLSIDFDYNFFELIKDLLNNSFLEDLSRAGIKGSVAGKALRKQLKILGENYA